MHPIIMFLISILLVAIGTLGYMLIEGWTLLDALYMTVITLATVGYGEIHELGQTGRIFTIVLIFFGVGLVLYVIGNIFQFLVEGRIRLILGRRKLDQNINRLDNHYIVCGYGRMGRALCGHLVERQADFVVIEQNADRTSVMDEDNVLYLVGGATEEKNLLKTGIERANCLMTALGTDADNVLLVLLAKSLNPDLFVVARASRNATKKPLYKAGADVVVSPFDVGARRMAHAVLRPEVIRFLELAFADESTDLHIEQIPVKKSSKLVNVPLMDSGIRQSLNLIILAIIRADDTPLFNPSATTCFEAGDTVIAVGENESIMKLGDILDP